MIIDIAPVTTFHLEFQSKLTVSSSDTITQRIEVLEDGPNVVNEEDYYQ
jgi:hypothetical protein